MHCRCETLSRILSKRCFADPVRHGGSVLFVCEQFADDRCFVPLVVLNQAQQIVIDVFCYGGTGCQGVAAVADVTVPGNVLLSNSTAELAAVQLSWYLAQQNRSFVLELQPSPDVLDGPAEINIDLASASSCQSLQSGCFLPSTGLCVMGLCTNMKVLVGVFGGWFAVAVASVHVYVNASTVTVQLTRSAFSVHAATSVLSLQLDAYGAALPCLANATALANITWSGNDTVAAVVIPLTFDPTVQVDADVPYRSVCLYHVHHDDTRMLPAMAP
jgi:hypothetical protein